MHIKEPILRAPAEAAKAMDASEPLQIALGDSGKRNVLWIIGTLVAVVVAAVALIVWRVLLPVEAHSPGYWGITLASVLFWLAVTQGMMAVGALLRISHASWRFPLTRMLDMVSLFGIPTIIILLPMLYTLRRVVYGPLAATGQGHPIGSAGHLIPLFGYEKVWRASMFNSSFGVDCLFTIVSYLAGFFLLWVTSRQDFASLRDRAEGGKRRMFQRLAGGWIGTQHQWRVQKLSEGFLVVGVVMAFFAGQTAIGWDYQLASGIDWDTNIFPFQVCLGSLMAGLAMLVLVMTVVQLRTKGTSLIGDKQYDSIGRLMMAFGLLFFYFRWCDYITAWYGHQPSEWVLQLGRTTRFTVLFIIMVVGCMAVPIFANIFGSIRKSPLWMSLISILMLGGIWCQRFLDTTPAFGYDAPGSMSPGAVWSGILATVGIGALFVLVYFLAIPLYSVISWWGMAKWRSRSSVQPYGNAEALVMVEDPPVWEN